MSLLSSVQFDFVKLLDGKALPRSLTDPVSTAKAPKGLLLSGLQETGFIEYMDPGTWHLALYNDGRNLEQVLLHSTTIGEETHYRFNESSSLSSLLIETFSVDTSICFVLAVSKTVACVRITVSIPGSHHSLVLSALSSVDM